MKRVCLTLGILIAGCCFTGCSSMMKTGISGRSLVEHLSIANGSLAPKEVDESLEMLFGMARVAERNGRSEQAIAAYNEILAQHPNHTPTLHRLGVVAARQGRIDEAMDYFIAAVKDDDPSAELLGDIGYTQYLANDLDAAAATLQKAIYKEPNNKRIINNLAIVMGMQQRFDDSLDLFRQTGSEAESLASVAFTQAQSGQLDEAKATYHRSLEADTSLEVAANGLVELDRATKDFKKLSKGSTELAGRAGINVSFPGEIGKTKPDEPRSRKKHSELVKSLAAVVRPKSSVASAKNKIAKPPVIAMPPAENSIASIVAEPMPPATAEIRHEQSSVEHGTTARIVMNPLTKVPVAQQPPRRFLQVTENQPKSFTPPPMAQTGSSSRRGTTTRGSSEPSFIRQVGYDEPISR